MHPISSRGGEHPSHCIRLLAGLVRGVAAILVLLVDGSGGLGVPSRRGAGKGGKTPMS